MNRLAQIRSLLTASPDDPFLRYALAKELESAGEIEDAYLQFEALVQSHPDYVAAYYHFGKLREKQGQIEAAIALYKQGIEVAKRQNDHHAAAELAAAKMNLED